MNKKQESISFTKWLKLSNLERAEIMSKWNVYEGDGEEIVLNVIREFKKKYGIIEKVKIHDHGGIYHGGVWVISVEYPFVFDKRKIPNEYLGISVHTMHNGELPKEFQIKCNKKEYVWSPERYVYFVNRYENEIRNKLQEPHITKYDILCALSGSDFNEFVEQCRKWANEGIIPDFKLPT